jgi:hypothetical protein
MNGVWSPQHLLLERPHTTFTPTATMRIREETPNEIFKGFCAIALGLFVSEQKTILSYLLFGMGSSLLALVAAEMIGWVEVMKPPASPENGEPAVSCHSLCSVLAHPPPALSPRDQPPTSSRSSFLLVVRSMLIPTDSATTGPCQPSTRKRKTVHFQLRVQRYQDNGERWNDESAMAGDTMLEKRIGVDADGAGRVLGRTARLCRKTR